MESVDTPDLKSVERMLVGVQVSPLLFTNLFVISMLSNKTVIKMAEALAPEVMDNIYCSEQWVTMLHDVIPDIITAKMGKLDDELLYELSHCVMDKIYLKCDT